LPKNVDFSVIDKFEKVTDKDAAVYQRRLAREEGIFVGNSAGSAIKGLLQLSAELTENDIVVVLFHDHGSRYVGKMFNDDWMRERGFLETAKCVRDAIRHHENKPLVTIGRREPVSTALMKMKRFDISQIPVVENNEFVGSLNDHDLFQLLIDNPNLKDQLVEEVMRAPFTIVEGSESLESAARRISKENPAVLVKNESGTYQILTRHDLINAFS
jgi:cystathionine beta-synthase